MADGAKVGSAYVEVTPKAAGNFKSVIEKSMPKGTDGGRQIASRSPVTTALPSL